MKDILIIEIEEEHIDKTEITLTLENMGYDVTEISSCIKRQA